MPYRDGTGPSGFGPGTGRGRGGYGLSPLVGTGFSARRMGFLGAFVPVVAAAVRDLANPDGLLRTAGKKLIARKTDNSKKPVDGSFTILDETDSKG
jgi:hypothetical protein